jgi:hypothetical protein
MARSHRRGGVMSMGDGVKKHRVGRRQNVSAARGRHHAHRKIKTRRHGIGEDDDGGRRRKNESINGLKQYGKNESMKIEAAMRVAWRYVAKIMVNNGMK